MPPHERAPEIPAPLSAVILKLLAKTAEERYQSAVGLRADLEDVLRASRAAGPGGVFVVPWAAPGGKDAFDRFQIPQQLYGRESAAESILDTYSRASKGRAELLLVGGHSGIGKSALVNELHRPVVARRGYFAGGKFDQLRREVPYASLVQAFASLVRQILTESDARLALFRARIAEALGHNGKLLTDLIPELAAVIGRQPEVPPLPPAEARNRFNFTFVRFVRALAAQEHPFVLFLDDLQWADLPSLKLVELLLGDPSVGHLLIIGAYRDNEVQSSTPCGSCRGPSRRRALASPRSSSSRSRRRTWARSSPTRSTATRRAPSRSHGSATSVPPGTRSSWASSCARSTRMD